MNSQKAEITKILMSLVKKTPNGLAWNSNISGKHAVCKYINEKLSIEISPQELCQIFKQINEEMLIYTAIYLHNNCKYNGFYLKKHLKMTKKQISVFPLSSKGYSFPEFTTSIAKFH